MLPTLKEATKELKPEAFSKLLKNVSLYEIYLVSLNSEIKRDLILKKINFDISFDDNYKMNLKSNPIYNCAKFDLVAKIVGTNQSFLTISATYHVSFKTKGKIPPEFWTIYEKFSLPDLIWAYFRELIQNFTSRMNIPPLILPLYFPEPSKKS
jgi:preprotein translocase subunit SecB